LFLNKKKERKEEGAMKVLCIWDKVGEREREEDLYQQDLG